MQGALAFSAAGAVSFLAVGARGASGQLNPLGLGNVAASLPIQEHYPRQRLCGERGEGDWLVVPARRAGGLQELCSELDLRVTSAECRDSGPQCFAHSIPFPSHEWGPGSPKSTYF